MSLLNIVLPDLLITELYKKVHLISNESPTTVTPEIQDKEPGTIKFLGNNQKKITIVVRHPGDVFLPEKHLEFLIKILGACKLNIGDVAIVNEGFKSFKSIDINTIIKQLQPKQVIIFGIEPTELKLPLSFPQFKLQEYALCTYLYVPSLDNLNTETEEGKLLKTKLWVCLKSMFEVSGTK
jgi:hypothetical protein